MTDLKAVYLFDHLVVVMIDGQPRAHAARRHSRRFSCTGLFERLHIHARLKEDQERDLLPREVSILVSQNIHADLIGILSDSTSVN